jgi:hypothetical protein
MPPSGQQAWSVSAGKKEQPEGGVLVVRPVVLRRYVKHFCGPNVR